MRRAATPANAWLGSLVEGQQDASGLVYMRNRYYDPKAGRFTQEDPIGIAGGLNTYGFVDGDPVNHSDPFGLCKQDDAVCQRLVTLLRSEKGSIWQQAAGRYEATQREVLIVPGDDPHINFDNVNRNGDPTDIIAGYTPNDPNAPVYLNGDLGEADLMASARHESDHVAGLTHRRDNAQISRNDERAYQQLSGSRQRDAVYLAWSVYISTDGKQGRKLPPTATEPKKDP